jgi:bacteriorhodopsin
MNTVLLTTYISIFVQLITGIIDIHALTLPLPPEHAILNPILKIEFIVQTVELAFYIWFVLSHIAVSSMAAARYFDWIFTTPVMLFTTIVFLKYKEHIEKKDPNHITVQQFIRDNRSNITIIFLANLTMLIFGYLGEIGIISRPFAFGAGFVGFAVSFSVIYNEYARKSQQGKRLFVFLLGIWSLYGFAFLLDPAAKNITFNFLDIVAKNFFGLYLVYVIYKVKGML